ncbi:LamG domain-containing protein [Nocardioides pinisoli]|uniref:LamG domain-containing protein n=1 Tax=Nocardioides pinisoli TaxID=2950279 RepID=A0ABT1KWD2_9ACTN|nr:LamG domain-containing protein [Nocardioides pinisoli]MCP3422083.1 LamG domain-containing protein [Nocardioides pinisoli]
MNRFRRLSTSVAATTTAAALAVALTGPPASARTDDLAGLWLLNEGAGQVANDLSFSGNSGRLGSTSSADAHDPEWITLPRLFLLKRAALRFSGSQSVRMPDAPSLEPDGVTVLARVRSTGPGAFRYVLSKGAFQCENASYGLYTGGDGGLRFYVSDGTQVHLSADAGPGLWDGAWHTVRGAFDGQELRLYVDGAQVGAPVPAPVSVYYGMPTGDDFYLGDYSGPCASPLGFVGDIDAAAVIGHYDDDASLAQ